MRSGTTRWLLAGLLCLALWTTALAQQTQWEKLNGAGMEAYERGRYAEAEKLWLAALKEAETFGGEHTRLATSLNNLAELYRAQGKYAQAEPLLRRALAIKEKALGPEHVQVATVLENYAALLHKLNRDAEADKMEARAQAIRAKHAQEIPQR